MDTTYHGACFCGAVEIAVSGAKGAAAMNPDLATKE